VQNTYIDVLNKASSAEWVNLKEQFSSLSGDVDHTLSLLNQYNNFLGINIANSPSFTASEALKAGSYGMVIAALIIPVLSAVTQWINVKLMPQQAAAPDSKNGNDSQAAMQQSMKTMNMMMPIMSAIFCFTLPAGMGLYWVAGAVMRSIQQVLINKHIDKMDIDEIIKKNEAKAKKKMEKEGVRAKQMAEYANMNTKNVNSSSKKSPAVTAEERAKQLKESNEYYNQNAKPGSMMSKANMVKQYNEKNNKN
jgi:YidC/Oxa1 family membrane protein insertase